MAKKFNEDKRRAMILLIGVLFILAFFLVNAQQYSYAFLIYLVLGVLGIFFYLFWNKISKADDLEGISKNWLKNSLVGLGLAVATIIVGSFIKIIGVIGYPTVSASIVGVGRFFVIVIFAPVFETIFLVTALTDFFDSKLGWNKWISLLIMALGSSLFHLLAYGNIISSAGDFISAFIMFFLFGLLVEKQKDISGAIVWHLVLNWNIAFPLTIAVSQNILPLIKAII